MMFIILSLCSSHLLGKAAHSVNRMFSLLCLVSHFGFEGGILGLIATVLGHCLLFNWIANCKSMKKQKLILMH